MAKLLEIAQWIMAHGLEVVAALHAILAALIAFFMVIPGDQPEKALQGVVDFIARFSRKQLPKE